MKNEMKEHLINIRRDDDKKMISQCLEEFEERQRGRNEERDEER